MACTTPGLQSARTRFVAVVGMCGVLGLSLVGCGQPVTEQDRADVLKLLDTLRQRMQREDYRAAMRCFNDRAQNAIRHIGGGPTPIDGFFHSLGPKLRHRTEVRVLRRRVWLTYSLAGDKKLRVALDRVKGHGWLITFMEGDGWRV